MNINYGKLIQNLGPVNNRFRDSEGYQKILALWEIGDILLSEIRMFPTDKVLWEINQRSFITRDVLRYGLIVRKEWKEKKEIEILFQNVKRFSLFREALPFLKGDRKGIDEKTFNKILKMIEKNQVSEVKIYIQNLKRKHIGRKNKKGVSKIKVTPNTKVVILFMDELLTKVNENTTFADEIRKHNRNNLFILISQAFYGLATDRGVPFINSLNDKKWNEFIMVLNEVAGGSREEKSAFRKLIGPLRLMEWADFFNAMCSQDDFVEWQARSKFQL